MKPFRSSVALGVAAGTVMMFAPSTAAADETRDSQWYLDTLDIAAAHEISTGKGVTIGLIDSGVDATHPDLVDAVEPGTALGIAEDPLVDLRDHGTGIASILAGRGHGDGQGILGIAPDAEIISVVIGWDEKTAADVDDWTAEGIRYLADQGVDIISVSTTTTGNNAGQEAVDYARDKGIPVIAAAGNKETESERLAVAFPGAYKDAIPVVGINEDGSPWGKSADVSPPGNPLAVSAPAQDLPSAKAGGGYFTNSGTSGAAPIVAGTFALVKSVYPDLDFGELVNRVLGSVDDAGPEGIDEDYGLGIINPVKALTAEIPGQEMKEPGAEDPADPGDDGVADGADDESAATDYTPFVIAGAAALVVLVGIVVIVKRRGGRNRGQGPDGSAPPGGWTPPAQAPPGTQAPPGRQPHQ